MIVSSVYDQVVAKVAERVSKLTVGPVKEVDNFTGPVSSKRAYEKINKYIEIGKQEGRVVAGGGRHDLAGEGWFIPPTVIADVDPKAHIAQEEIFGPVRKCTGAMVDVHPFGGFNMSGTDSKAGGRDYLGLFLQAKSVAEKL